MAKCDTQRPIGWGGWGDFFCGYLTAMFDGSFAYLFSRGVQEKKGNTVSDVIGFFIFIIVTVFYFRKPDHHHNKEVELTITT